MCLWWGWGRWRIPTYNVVHREGKLTLKVEGIYFFHVYLFAACRNTALALNVLVCF